MSGTYLLEKIFLVALVCALQILFVSAAPASTRACTYTIPTDTVGKGSTYDFHTITGIYPHMHVDPPRSGSYYYYGSRKWLTVDEWGMYSHDTNYVKFGKAIFSGTGYVTEVKFNWAATASTWSSSKGYVYGTDSKDYTSNVISLQATGSGFTDATWWTSPDMNGRGSTCGYNENYAKICGPDGTTATAGYRATITLSADGAANHATQDKSGKQGTFQFRLKFYNYLDHYTSIDRAMNFEITVVNLKPTDSSLTATCDPCGPGFTGASTGECTLCANGLYKSTTGNVPCTVCPIGYASTYGASNPIQGTACDTCIAGQFQPEEGQTECTTCGKGEFQDDTGQSTCKDCVAGKYVFGTSAAEHAICSDCVAGTYISTNALNDKCLICPKGYASASGAGTGATSCTQCTAGKFTGDGTIAAAQLTCTNCALGKISAAAGLTDCIICPRGKYVGAAGQSSCTECGGGTFNDDGTNLAGVLASAHDDVLDCKRCPVGWASYSATASGACYDCAGSTNAEQTSCAGGGSGCAPGEYKDTNCKNCNAGYYSISTSATECTECPAGYYATAVKASSCTSCAAGKYQASTAETTGCDSCGKGKFSSTVAAATSGYCLECPAGKYSTETGNVSPGDCINCSRGKYSAQTGQQTEGTCWPCERGKYSDTDAATLAAACVECARGRYGDQEGLSSSNACKPCGTGKYQNYPGRTLETGCQLCPEGFFGPSTGAISSDNCADCPVGKFSATAGISSSGDCDECNSGKYNDQPKQSSDTCISCAVGKYLEGKGSASVSLCLNCPSGFFNGNRGSSFCIACTTGKYSDQVEQEFCKVCPAGFALVQEAVENSDGETTFPPMSACKACTVGKSSAEAAAVCSSCEPGKWASYKRWTMTITEQAVEELAGVTVTQVIDAVTVTGTLDTALSGSTTSIVFSPINGARFNALANLLVGTTPIVSSDIDSAVGLTAAEECVSCAKGSSMLYRKPTAKNAGTEDTMPTSCTACPSGWVVNATSSATCESCPSGKKEVGLLACEDCSAGKYQTAKASSSCTNCVAGKYGGIGSSFCIECSLGQIAAIPMSSICSKCTSGKYSDQVGLDDCKTCGNGQYAPQAAPACSQCAEGQYKGTNDNACVKCPLGFAQPAVAQASCVVCGDGQYAPIGAPACSQCAEGQYKGTNDNACVKCPLGFAQPAVAQASCVACAVGAYSLAGAPACSLCAEGQYKGSGDASCKKCPLGYAQPVAAQGDCDACGDGSYAPVGAPACSLCAEGQYKGSTDDSCKKCPLGWANNQTEQAACTECAIGAYSLAGAPACSLCAEGQYKGTNDNACVKCPLGYAQPVAAQGDCDACGIGAYALVGAPACSLCAEGQYKGTNDNKCNKCPEGWAQPLAKQGDCNSCGDGAYALEGAPACSLCAEGQYKGSTDDSCKKCPLGWANDQTEQAACDECAIGAYSLEGAPACSLCAEGQYKGTNDNACVKCPLGYAQPVAAQGDCDVCGEGLYSLVGAPACSECAGGQYKGTNDNACKSCPVGWSQPTIAQGDCDVCDPGKSSLEASPVCGECTKGQYRGANDGDVCLSCDVGEFANETGSVACGLCPPGSSSLKSASACSLCNTGRYQAQGDVLCSSCKTGFYAEHQGTAVKCKVCNAGRMSATGASDCIDCTPGRYRAFDSLRDFWAADEAVGYAYVDCAGCVEGKFAKESGTTECINCLPGTSSANAAPECSPCESGRFQGGDGTECKACSAGTYSVKLKNENDYWVGPTACKDCPVGFTAKTAAPACSECDPGRFNNAGTNLLCAGCIPGRYADQYNATMCKDCDAGFSSLTAAPECGACDPGRYKISTGDGTCDACLSGFYADQAGSTGCKECAAGQTAGEASPSCTNCVGGRYHNGTLSRHWENDWTITATAQTINEHMDVAVTQVIGAVTHTGWLKAALAGETTEIIIQAISGVVFDATHDLVIGTTTVNADTITTSKNTAALTADDYSGECQAYAIGRFSEAPFEECQDCPDGYSSTAEAAPSCTGCEAGRYFKRELGQASTGCLGCAVGRFQDGVGETDCKNCDAGRYTPAGEGTVTCSQCAGGRYHEGWGGTDESWTECRPCLAGTFSTSGLTVCLICPFGTGSGQAAPQCESCAAGMYRPDQKHLTWAGVLEAAAENILCDTVAGRQDPRCPSGCSGCTAGQFSGARAPNCTACPAGYQSGGQAPSCNGCVPGKFQNKLNSIACKNCGPGKFTNNYRALDCALCAAGQSAQTAAKVCSDCRPGKSVSRIGADTCDDCPAGFSQDRYSTTTCNGCAPGKFSAQGKEECLKCGVGKFAPDQKTAFDCEPCESGKYSVLKGQDTCMLCPKGWKKETKSIDECTRCDAGTVAAEDGAFTCQKCAANTRQHEKAKTVCLECRSGRFVDEGSSREVCNLPSPQTSPEPPNLLRISPGNNLTNVVLHLQIDAEYRKTNVNQDDSLASIVVEYCSSVDFAEKSTFISDHPLPLDVDATVELIDLDLGVPYLTTAWFFRVRYVLQKDGWVTKASVVSPRWHTIGPRETSCNDNEYLRVFPQDNASQLMLPLALEDSNLMAWSKDGTLRRCMTCPRGAHCVGHVISEDVRPKWGYWRIPWAHGKSLNETFVSCGGDLDCLGAAEANEDIVLREIVGLGPTIPGEEDYQYLKTQQCETLELGAEAAMACCEAGDPLLCEDPALHNCVCPGNGENATSGGQKKKKIMERCQEGRIADSVTCAVCQPEYMRSRGGCIRCYAAGTRYAALGLAIACMILLLLLVRLIWKKMYRYRNAWRDIMRILVINITLMQINTSVDAMIPIEWPEVWLEFKSYFEWADIDLMSLSGTTCVAGVNYYFTFAAMGSVPYFIVLMATLYFVWQKCTLNYRLKHMSKAESQRRHEDAYLDAFLLSDKDDSGVLSPHELAELLNHELHLDHFRKGKFKIDVTHALKIIKKIAGHNDTMEMPLMMFLEAMENETLDKAVNEVCELPVNHRDSGKDAMLRYVMNRGMFGASFMLASHMLLLAHAPVSKKVFIYYLCRDIGGRSFIRSDYSIQCYTGEWKSFEPAVMFVLVTFTVGFPVLLMVMMFWNRNRLYRRDVYARMGFLYERYIRGAEWWEIHEMLRKVVLTGLLLFTSERPMVRAVLATLVCCLMIINLNFFQPHRNLIVFWVEQLANLSATIKYLFAVVIAGGGGDLDGGNSKLGYDDMRSMGYLLVASDVACLVISFGAIIGCVVLLRRSIVAVEREEDKKMQAVKAGKNDTSFSQNIQKRLSMTAVQPQAHRRTTMRSEAPAANGLSAMLAHANDHLEKKTGLKFNLKKITQVAHQEHAVKKAETEHDESLQRHNIEIAKKAEAGHNRLQARLQKRKSTAHTLVVKKNGRIDPGPKIASELQLKAVLKDAGELNIFAKADEGGKGKGKGKAKVATTAFP